MDHKIGIIGQGFVGSSIREGMIEDYPELLTYDINPSLRNTNSLANLVEYSNIIFVCVPTPMRENGECYTGIVEKVVKDITVLATTSYSDLPASKIIILKTTVPPGTTEKLQAEHKDMFLVFNPEFLTEANAVEDFKNQNRIILGGDNDTILNTVAGMYKKSFPFIPVVHMQSRDAEMVKYVTNTFLATKVIFANEIHRICQGLDIHYPTVINAAKLDTRLGDSHWKVPGPDGDHGFGGHCFPKDMNAIKFAANQKHVATPLLDAVLKTNDLIRKNRDWEEQEGRSVITEKSETNV